jgi:hypothetical protein
MVFVDTGFRVSLFRQMRWRESASNPRRLMMTTMMMIITTRAA